MIDYLQGVDSQLLLFFNGMHLTFFDRFMMMATGRFIWVPFYLALLAVLMVRLGWKQSLLWLAAIGITITIADQVCATWIRPIAERLRPAHPDNPLAPLVHIVDGYRSGHYGFPSCHAANSFALTTIFSLVAKRRIITLTLVVWALLNCYTRIYLGVHYPGDILVGAAIGALAGWMVYSVTGLLLRRFPSKHTTLTTTALGRFNINFLPMGVLTAIVVAIALASLCQM